MAGSEGMCTNNTCVVLTSSLINLVSYLYRNAVTVLKLERCVCVHRIGLSLTSPTRIKVRQHSTL